MTSRPAPFWLCSSRRPPWSSASSRAMVRPKPWPGLDSSSRQPGSMAARDRCVGEAGAVVGDADRDLAALRLQPRSSPGCAPRSRHCRANCRASRRGPADRSAPRGRARSRRPRAIPRSAWISRERRDKIVDMRPRAASRRGPHRHRSRRARGRDGGGHARRSARPAARQPPVGIAPRQIEPQPGERRLEAVREIGDMAARLRQRRPVGVDQRVELGDQRQQLGRFGRRDMLARSGAHLGERGLQCRERPQSDPELDEDRHRHRQPEREQRQQQRRHRLVQRPVDHRARPGREDADVAARRRERQQAAVDAARPPASRASNGRGSSASCGGPKRAYGGQSSGTMSACPSEPERSVPPGAATSHAQPLPARRTAARRSRVPDRSGRRAATARATTATLRIEPVVEPVRHEAFEHMPDRERREAQRDEDRDARGDQQPPEQRSRQQPHAALSVRR